MDMYEELKARKLGGAVSGGFTPTQAQLDAMNSGITSAGVAQISANTADIALKQDASTAINTTNLKNAAYALGSVVNLGDSGDLNSLTAIGNYYGNSNNILNRPGNIKTFRLIVQSDGNTANYVEQIFNEYQGAREYRRYNTSSIGSGEPVTWSDWVLVNGDFAAEQAKTTGMTEGGSDYITVGGIRLYLSATEPTGTIPTGAVWLGGSSVKKYDGSAWN